VGITPHRIQQAILICSPHRRRVLIEAEVAARDELVRHGYRFEVEELCAWAATNGFTGSEVGRLRELAQKALA
jgi:hypothetical protein